jgi:hypothetical protein
MRGALPPAGARFSAACDFQSVADVPVPVFLRATMQKLLAPFSTAGISYLLLVPLESFFSKQLELAPVPAENAAP